MDRKALVAKALAEKALLKMLTEAHAQTRAELAELFTDPGDREVGKLLDQRIGTVALEDGRESWYVADEPKFRAWVETNFDDEIEWIPRVRPALQAIVLKQCAGSEYGSYMDPVTGEILYPAGVECRKGAPMLVERPDKDAESTVRVWLGAAAEQLGIEGVGNDGPNATH